MANRRIDGIILDPIRGGVRPLRRRAVDHDQVARAAAFRADITYTAQIAADVQRAAERAAHDKRIRDRLRPPLPTYVDDPDNPLLTARFSEPLYRTAVDDYLSFINAGPVWNALAIVIRYPMFGVSDSVRDTQTSAILARLSFVSCLKTGLYYSNRATRGTFMTRVGVENGLAVIDNVRLTDGCSLTYMWGLFSNFLNGTCIVPSSGVPPSAPTIDAFRQIVTSLIGRSIGNRAIANRTMVRIIQNRANGGDERCAGVSFSPARRTQPANLPTFATLSAALTALFALLIERTLETANRAQGAVPEELAFWEWFAERRRLDTDVGRMLLFDAMFVYIALMATAETPADYLMVRNMIRLNNCIIACRTNVGLAITLLVNSNESADYQVFGRIYTQYLYNCVQPQETRGVPRPTITSNRLVAGRRNFDAAAYLGGCLLEYRLHAAFLALARRLANLAFLGEGLTETVYETLGLHEHPEIFDFYADRVAPGGPLSWARWLRTGVSLTNEKRVIRPLAVVVRPTNSLFYTDPTVVTNPTTDPHTQTKRV